MHNKKFFALAGVFLAVALASPPVILFFEGVSELVAYENTGHQTAGNMTFLEQVQQSRQGAYILVAVVEAVFVLLFVVTLYYGINHLPQTSGKVRPSRFDQEP
jgi:hypothetical protein